MGQGQRFGRIVVLLSLAVALTSCGGGEEDAQSEAAPTQNGVGSVAEPANAAPKISGAPSKSIVAGSQYRFTPKAADSNDDVLTFKVRNKPEWANFNSRTGELSGTPDDADVNTYSNIEISVTDGAETAELPPFSITVQAIGTGTATLAWMPPTERTDGTALTDLAGFKVYWGSESGDYTKSVQIDNPAVTTYVVDNLGSGTYYFATTALSGDGLESDYSNEASKTIQ